jgi:UDPglucose--hexose-1-phosphate uridylyltransferase
MTDVRARPRRARVRRSSGHLADGRELIYFDDSEPYVSGRAQRSFEDRRALEPHADDSRMRFDELSGEWVAFATHRMDRTHLPPADLCPLCPTRPGREPTEIPADDYDVVVFENRFPSFAGVPTGGFPGTGGFASRTGDTKPPGAVKTSDDVTPDVPAYGRCEVVCFTSDHDTHFHQLGAGRVRTVIEAWANRTAELSTRPGVAQVAVFENRGREIGVTLHHPHGQIYAYPFVVPRTEAMLRQAERHRRTGGDDLLGDLLTRELDAGARVVTRGDRWTTFVPVAARWPVEVRVVPHRQVPDLAALDDGERDELAAVYPELLRRFDDFYPKVVAVPYIAAWHQAPVGDGRELCRLHLHVFSIMRAPRKLKYLAGSESAMGAWVNDTTPERIAGRLRELAP